ncbi:BtrH N-terminal domain-containing protein [Psychromicrobium lacuslunae]|uniref:Lantibiotic ABC transporter n=1 Tax=Psychromicrobium lacuslunae TaxID=1618207 RepID=A0A0D4C168_9MICC|nr:BtrH N-terminal domain-containing protein [Psychromicrobium lacuslunae]AJT42437.1 lantibiotic ABC transporter [Psychromicrobium lacuslunae]
MSKLNHSLQSLAGQHCETTALGVLLSHSGIDLSEPMLFGLGSGLSFIYWDSKKQDFPFLGGRVKPFQLTQSLAARLGLTLHSQETSSAQKAWEQVRSSVDQGIPVGLQLDSYYLDYFTSRVHFAGHMVALYDYDEETAFIVDTEQQGGCVSTSLSSLRLARAAGGAMSARHRSFTLTLPDSGSINLASAIIPAITECAQSFLAPPIANLGHRGIRTTASRITGWFDRVENPHRDLPIIATLMERAGTGGALFRRIYRDFLTECLPLVSETGSSAASTSLERGRDLFAESAQLWTQVAGLIERAGLDGDPATLQQASGLLNSIAELETAAMTLLASLDSSA